MVYSLRVQERIPGVPVASHEEALSTGKAEELQGRATIPRTQSEEKLKSLLMKVKEERRKSWLKAQHSENKDHGIWSHHFMGNRLGNSGNCVRLYFGGLQNHCRW